MQSQNEMVRNFFMAHGQPASEFYSTEDESGKITLWRRVAVLDTKTGWVEQHSSVTYSKAKVGFFARLLGKV